MKLLKTRKAYIVCGCSWHGNLTKRDKKTVNCGHKHKTWQAASKCISKMRKERPGNCQDYRAFEFIWIPKLKAGLLERKK